jgi:hypothetical protein
MKKMIFGKLWMAAVAAALVFSGCEQGLGLGGSTGKLTVNLLGLEPPQTDIPPTESSLNILKTVFPTVPESHFTKYELSFAPSNGGLAITSETMDTTCTVTLPVGDYDLTVTGYATVNEVETAIAVGKVEGITVAQSGNTPVEVTLGPNTDVGGTGTFSYEIALDGVSELDTGSVLYITTFDDTSTHIDINDGDEGTDITLASGQNLTGSIDLSAGYYRVWIVLKKGSAEARLPGEVVHIYTGLTSTLPEQTFSNSDFGTVAEVTAFELKDYFAYPVVGGTPATGLTGLGAAPQYTGTIAWNVTNDAGHTGIFGASTAYTAVVSLTAGAGWTFDEVTENSFTYTDTGHVESVTNPAGEGLALEVTVKFKATGTINGNAAITVGFGHDEMVVTNYSGPLEVAQNGANVTWSVSSYENVTWTVDDAAPVSGNYSLTLIPGNYAVKKHRAVVSGAKNGKPYSKILEFTITEGGEEPPEPEPETVANNAAVTSYLSSKSENTVDTPYTLKFASSWTPGTYFAYDLAAILNNHKSKYVALDMSDLTFTNNTITGSVNNKSEDFNSLYSATNVVGIILPTNLTKLSAAFYGMTSLKWIDIPSDVTSIDANTFKKCSGLTKITIYRTAVIGTGKTSAWQAFVSPGKTDGAAVTDEGSFHALYTSQVDDFSGVYTYNDESWSKSALAN